VREGCCVEEKGTDVPKIECLSVLRFEGEEEDSGETKDLPAENIPASTPAVSVVEKGPPSHESLRAHKGELLQLVGDQIVLEGHGELPCKRSEVVPCAKFGVGMEEDESGGVKWEGLRLVMMLVEGDSFQAPILVIF